MMEQLAEKTRSVRRFKENETVERNLLKKLVNIARLTPSAMNLQPIKYFISSTKETNDIIFPSLKWAGYLKDWDGPEPGQRPSAYILILGDTNLSKNIKWDMGITAYSIMLGAADNGLGGCILGSMDKKQIHKDLKLDENLEILLTCAIGKPDETVIIEEAKDSIKYYRDEKDIHHVPKRPLSEIIIE